MTTEPQTPSQSSDLAAELAGILRTGVTLKALEQRCPTVLGLSVVRAKAASQAPSDLAVAAVGVIREAAITVDEGDPSGPHGVLLRVSPSRLALLKQRRFEVGRLLGISADHVRDYREAGLIEDIADDLYARDSVYRLRQKHRTEPERDPTRSRSGTEWFELHKSYRRVWTPIAALRDDLWVLLKLLRDEAEWPDIADRVMTMTWRLTQFSVEGDRHVDELGGVWLLDDIEADVKVAGALRRINFHVPFGEADVSWLRLVLAETPARELDPFIDRVYPTERGKEVVQVWLTWAKGCACDPDNPDPADCTVHQWLAACDDFIGLIDDHWYRIADQYRATEAGVRGLDVRALWEPPERD